MSVHILRNNQLIARPAQFLAPKTAEDRMAKLNPIEIHCLNIRIREAGGAQKYTSKQLELLERVNTLSRNIYNPQLNKWRLLLSHLIIMPKNLGFSQAFFTDGKTNHKIYNKEEFCSFWNSTLLKVYCVFEVSCYMVNEEKSSCISSINSLQENIVQDTFKSQKFSESVKSDLQLLIDALQNDELLAILLSPLDNPSDYLLTPEKIDCYLKVLTFSKEAASQCIQVAKKLPNRAKKTTTESLNQWIKMIKDLELISNGLLHLQGKVLAGSEEHLFKFSEALHLLSPVRINDIYKEILHNIEQAIPVDSVFKIQFECYMRHSAALLTRTTIGLFDVPCSQLEISTEFIRKLKPKLNARSDYFTPLDIYRMWWMEPLLRKQSAIESIGYLEMLFQILRAPEDNIYGKLGHVELAFKKLEELNTQSFHEEPFKLFKSLLVHHSYQFLIGWLNAPLNYKDCKRDDTHFFLQMKLQYAQFASMTEAIVIPDTLNSTQENIIQQHHSSHLQLKQKAEQNEEETKHKESEALNDFARTAFSMFGDDSIEQLENMLSDLTVLDQETKNKWFMFQDDIRKLYLRPFILKGGDLAPLKAPTKLRHRTKNHEPIQYKAKAGKQKQRVATIISERPLPTIAPSMQNAFETLLQSSPYSLHFNLKNLISLLDHPVSVEAIYCTLARTLEAHFQPEQNHSLEQFGTNEEDKLWLQKMQSFLPLRFALSKIDPDGLEGDLKRTAQVLGAQTVPAFSLNRPEYSGEEIWIGHFKNALLSSKERLNAEGVSHINGEFLLERRIRQKLCKDILDFTEATIIEIEEILKQAKEQALPQALLGHLILKVGQIAEGSMKLHFLTAPIISEANPQSHRAFEEVAGRPRRYDHDLARVYEVSKTVVQIDLNEVELIQKWRYFATAARYEITPNDCQLTPFLKKAALLFPEFLTEKESKKLKQLGLEGKGREELLRMQQDELIPEVEKLLGMSLKLL